MWPMELLRAHAIGLQLHGNLQGKVPTLRELTGNIVLNIMPAKGINSIHDLTPTN